MDINKAKELLIKYGNNSDLTSIELKDIINLLEQGEECRKFLDKLKWTTIYEGDKIILQTKITYWDIKEHTEEIEDKEITKEC